MHGSKFKCLNLKSDARAPPRSLRRTLFCQEQLQPLQPNFAWHSVGAQGERQHVGMSIIAPHLQRSIVQECLLWSGFVALSAHRTRRVFFSPSRSAPMSMVIVPNHVHGKMCHPTAMQINFRHSCFPTLLGKRVAESTGLELVTSDSSRCLHMLPTSFRCPNSQRLNFLQLGTNSHQTEILLSSFVIRWLDSYQLWCAQRLPAIAHLLPEEQLERPHLDCRLTNNLMLKAIWRELRTAVDRRQYRENFGLKSRQSW